MHTMRIRMLDAQYKVITKEARKRRVSVHELIDEWLIAGEEATVSFKSSMSTFTDEEHAVAERRVLSKRHRALAKRIRSRQSK